MITPLPFGGGDGGGANWLLVCEVTPTGLLIEGEVLLNIRRTRRGISVITPLSIRRGAGGEASDGCWVCKENSNLERRKALVSSKRTPFSLIEDALLDPY